jgi:hypothetical protein
LPARRAVNVGGIANQQGFPLPRDFGHAMVNMKARGPY